jgi:hypothetical protein
MTLHETEQLEAYRQGRADYQVFFPEGWHEKHVMAWCRVRIADGSRFVCWCMGYIPRYVCYWRIP